MTMEEKDKLIRKVVNQHLNNESQFFLIVIKECCHNIKSLELKDKLDCYFFLTKDIKILKYNIYDNLYTYLYNLEGAYNELDYNNLIISKMVEEKEKFKQIIFDRFSKFKNKEDIEIPSYKLEDFNDSIITLYSQQQVVDYHIIDDCEFIHRTIINLTNQYYPDIKRMFDDIEYSNQKYNFHNQLMKLGNHAIKAIIEFNVQIIDKNELVEWSIKKDNIRQTNIINALQKEAQKIYESYKVSKPQK